MALRLSTTAQLFHAKVPNIFPRISSHDLPCHKTMKRLCQSQVSNFSMAPAEILDSNIFCDYPQYPSLFDILFECNPNTLGQRTMSALPINVFHSYFPSRIHVFCFCLPVWFRPRVQIRIVLFRGWEISIPNLELFSNRVPTELSRFVFPTIFLPKDDRTDSAQEEQPGLPYWTMILVMYASVDASKDLDILTCEFSIILEHLPFLPGCKQILRPLLVLRILAVWIWYPWLLLPSFVMLMILALWILHKTQNHLSQCRLGVQLDLCIFGALSPIRHSSNDRCPSVRQNELLRPSSLFQRLPLICFWLLSGPTPKFSPIFPFLVHCCFFCGNFRGWPCSCCVAKSRRNCGVEKA